MNVVDVLPSIFISHGAPDILLSKHRAVAAMRELAGRTRVWNAMRRWWWPGRREIRVEQGGAFITVLPTAIWVWAALNSAVEWPSG